MKATCNRSELLTAFQMVSGVVPTRSTKPIIQNVKLVANKERAFLLATDLEVGIRCSIQEFNAERPGELVFPTAQMTAILRESDDEQIRIDANDSTIRVEGERSHFDLPSEPPEEFPDVPDFEEGKQHLVSPSLLRTMIRRTIFSTDSESVRYALNGLLVELEGDSITLVGTDGRRLAVMRGTGTNIGEHNTDGGAPVIPTKAMHLIDRNLQGEEEDVALAIQPNRVLMRSSRVVISSRLVEGRFPKYQEVFPSRQSFKISLNVGDFLRSVRQSAIVTNEESRGVTATFSEGQLELIGQSPEAGRSQVKLPIAYDGSELGVTFDPRFLVDMLRVLNEESTVTLELIDSESAAVFKTEDGYSYVVMPLTRGDR